MHRFHTRCCFATTVVLFLSFYLPQRGFAQYWTNGQAASYVIGQSGFGSNTAALTATGLETPSGIAVDPATGKVFVTDQTHNRVLRYPSTAALTNGAAAEAVLGQTDFTSGASGTTGTTLGSPAGLAIDASGNLWVADDANDRVLRYANAATIASGAAASGVLGQPNFTSRVIAAASATTLDGPIDVFSSGTTLWVTDRLNNRILRYDNAASKANGGAADGVIGQPDFISSASGLSATQLNTPFQVYLDGAGNLWVADSHNDRILMFPDAPAAANGEAATLVLGQASMTASGAGTTAMNLTNVQGVYGDGVGNIYIADGNDHRILIFPTAAGLSNGAAAGYVLGQSSFITRTSGDGANQLDLPTKLFVNASLLAVADFENNRVLLFTPSQPLPLLLTGFTGRLQGNGQVLLQWQVSDQGGSGVAGGSGGSSGSGAGGGGTVALEYSTIDTMGFTEVLNTQPVEPAVSGYSYVQVSPAAGVNYYRVKLTSLDGAVVYSPVVTINVGSGVSSGLSIYPNPASSAVVVTVPRAAAAVIEVYNSGGGLMQGLATTSSVNTLGIGVWAAGVYVVKVVQGGTVRTGSFIKMN
jgi:hypothetical protein